MLAPDAGTALKECRLGWVAGGGNVGGERRPGACRQGAGGPLGEGRAGGQGRANGRRRCLLPCPPGGRPTPGRATAAGAVRPLSWLCRAAKPPRLERAARLGGPHVEVTPRAACRASQHGVMHKGTPRTLLLDGMLQRSCAQAPTCAMPFSCSSSQPRAPASMSTSRSLSSSPQTSSSASCSSIG